MLITNATVITLGDVPRVLPDSAIYIDGGTVLDLGASSELAARYPEVETLDARGQYVMPGGICAHTHFYGAYARGMAIPGPAPRDFPRDPRALVVAPG